MKTMNIIGVTTAGLLATNIAIKGLKHGAHFGVLHGIERAIAHGTHYGAGRKLASFLFTPFWALRS